MIQTDKINEQIYVELSAILSGCDTMYDALPFGNIYINKYPTKKEFIQNIINGKTYSDTVDVGTKREFLYDLTMCETKEEAEKIASQLEDRTTDISYKQAIKRIINKKLYKNDGADQCQLVVKKCPHCGHNLTLSIAATYVICGYHDSTSGYDWNGCGRDWCFRCEKILCKNWHDNLLHCSINRVHDYECCKKHAEENNKKYPEEYCQCKNIHVNRFSLPDCIDDIKMISEKLKVLFNTSTETI